MTTSWNDDFVLSSLYQWSWDGTGTRTTTGLIDKCSPLHSTVESSTASSPTTLTSRALAKEFKCTYIVDTTSAAKVPAFKLAKLGTFAKIQLHWAEWDKSAMTSGAFLPASTLTPLFLGTYVATKPYPNPITVGAFSSFTANTLSF